MGRCYTLVTSDLLVLLISCKLHSKVGHYPDYVGAIALEVPLKALLSADLYQGWQDPTEPTILLKSFYLNLEVGVI